MIHAPTELYLDLMIRCLTDLIYEKNDTVGLDGRPFRSEYRETGYDWPLRAHTMIGVKRLQNIQHCAQEVFRLNLDGDFMETGVWRGGATIFMRALLAAYQQTGRRVWVADSFAGLPPPDAERFPEDAGDEHHKQSVLGISLEDVKANFERYNLLDDQVVFLPGWFRDTLPTCDVKELSILRLDGDMYESTMIALEALYPKLVKGGFLIVDDYGAVPGCKQAVTDYRSRHGITARTNVIDWAGVFWQKTD